MAQYWTAVDGKPIYVCKHCASVIGGKGASMDALNGWCGACGKWRDGAPPPSDKMIWVTRDHENIIVRNMQTSHLQYAIHMIMERENWRKRYITPLLEELKRRKEAGEA